MTIASTLDAVAAALTSAGIANTRSNTTDPHPYRAGETKVFEHLHIRGVDVATQIDIEPEHGGGRGIFSKPNGRFRCTTRFDGRTSWPERKDGSFNYEAIAAAAGHYVTRRENESAKKVREQANMQAAVATRAAVSAIVEGRYGDVHISPSDDAALPVELAFSRSFRVRCTPAQAETFAAAYAAAMAGLGFKV